MPRLHELEVDQALRALRLNGRGAAQEVDLVQEVVQLRPEQELLQGRVELAVSA